MERLPLFTPWGMTDLAPVYDCLRELEPPEAYALMRAMHAAERRNLLRPMLDDLFALARPRLELAPRLRDHHDLDAVARQFADYVLDLNLDSVFVAMYGDDPDRLLGEVVDFGNVEVLDDAVKSGPVLLTPLHTGPCYASLVALARRHPITTLYHRIPLDAVRDRWFPDVDLAGIQVPRRGVMDSCLQVLESGRLLSIFPELDPSGIGPLHVPVPFLGTHVAAPTGTVLIAQRAGALIAPYTFRSVAPGRFAFDFEPPIDPGTDAADRHAVAAAMFRIVERVLLDGNPGEWEMWAEFERMADASWVASQLAEAA